MIEFEDVTITAGPFTLAHISFGIQTGEYAMLMGKTGCGKTTLMESICGLRAVSSGVIRLMGTEVTHHKASQRGIGFVPQDGALFSTMTVRDHLAFALKIRKWPPRAVTERVESLAEQLGISPLLDRKPQGLSGGEAQRVALGRALSAHPSILCLDEPLSALDDHTREEMCKLLESIHEEYRVTILHITHRLDEARRLADRILFLSDGCIRDNSSSEMENDRGTLLNGNALQEGAAEFYS